MVSGSRRGHRRLGVARTGERSEATPAGWQALSGRSLSAPHDELADTASASPTDGRDIPCGPCRLAATSPATWRASCIPARNVGYRGVTRTADRNLIESQPRAGLFGNFLIGWARAQSSCSWTATPDRSRPDVGKQGAAPCWRRPSSRSIPASAEAGRSASSSPRAWRHVRQFIPLHAASGLATPVAEAERSRLRLGDHE